jgi:hypothetical protein
MAGWSKNEFPFFGNNDFLKNSSSGFSKTRNTGSGQKMLKKFFKKMQPFWKRGQKSSPTEADHRSAILKNRCRCT